MGVFHVFKIVQMLPNRAMHHIFRFSKQGAGFYSTKFANKTMFQVSIKALRKAMNKVQSLK